MEVYEDIEGRRNVARGFSLAAHFRALEPEQCCYVFLRDYSKQVIQVTAYKLRKEGYKFKTNMVRRGKTPVTKIKVTRIE